MDHKIVVIGGDTRYLGLIKQLKAMPKIELILVGFDKIDQGFTELIHQDFEDLTLDEVDVVILPITGTNLTGDIDNDFSDHKIKLSKQWFKQLKKGTKVFTGVTNKYLSDAVEAANVSLIPLLDRDDVAIYNSIPTAEGTIMIAMEQTDYTIHSANIIVTGYGRIGKTIANKFSAIGANVAVSSLYCADHARIVESGFQPLHLNDLAKHTQTCDILINTIPAKVINHDSIKNLPAHAIIIDLASGEGGTDFKYAKSRGIKAILAKGLPGVVAPKTAGIILADAIKQLL